MRRLAVMLALASAAPVAAAQSSSAEGGPADGRVLWLRADDNVRKNLSNLVFSWRDRGTGTVVIGSTPETQPEWRACEICGQPALHFDGNDFLYNTAAMPTGSYTKVVVCSIDDPSAVNNVVSGYSRHALWFGASSKARMFHSGDFVTSSVDVAAHTPVVLVATFDATTRIGRLFQDGVLVGQGSTPWVNDDPWLLLGSFAFGNFLEGSIAEVMLYDRVLTDPECTQVADYLRRRYEDPATPIVQWTSLPQPGAVLQRDANSQLQVHVDGAVTSPGSVDVTLEVTRDGAPFFSKTKPLVYSGGAASFTFHPTLYAGLHDHEVSVFVSDGRTRRLVANVPNVTVGDVYLVNGQSNAVAADYWAEHLANQSQHHWIRSFGTQAWWGGTEFDLHWDLAEGEGSTHAAIGAWALRLGEVLMQQEHLPIAILNGAVGGTKISQHQRNDADPTDLTTIYGRLLLRAQQSGVASAAKALLWYQGESDSGNASGWLTDWVNLQNDWAVDYPALQHKYLFQIRSDCGGGGFDVMEVQRTLPDSYSDVSVMATNGAPGHDGCHYVYAGYRELGERMVRLLQRDFYGSTDTGIDAPNMLSAKWGDKYHTKIVITFRDPNDALTIDKLARLYFQTNTGDNIVKSRVSNTNEVTLTLFGPSSATTVSWLGHAGDGPWLENGRGIGALTFYGATIQ